MTTPDTHTQCKSAVREAIATLRAPGAFGGVDIREYPDGQGGAWIELVDVPLGPPYSQAGTFVVVLLPFTLPGSDIYPLFVRSDLCRIDGQALGQAFQRTQLSWPAEAQPREVVQVSRRTRGAFASQTALQKISKVLDWMLSL